MKRNLITYGLIVLMFSFLNKFTYGQIIKTKDGVEIGTRNELISECVKGIQKEVFGIQGMEVNAYNYCTCVSDRIIPNLLSQELINAIENNTINDLFLKEENLRILLDCLTSNVSFDDNYKLGSVEYSSQQKDFFVKKCFYDVMTESEETIFDDNELAEQYCLCVFDKLISSNYTFKDMMEIENESSIVFNEVTLSCIRSVYGHESFDYSLNFYNRDDIIGRNAYNIIPLIDFFGLGYKVKIAIDGITRYFLFDTGASGLVIDRNLERELLLNGSLKRESYLHKEYYVLANNQQIEAQLVVVNNILIGDYKVNNVIIAIIDEGELLLGKGLLDKFKRWELDIEKKQLILYKD